VSGGCEEVGRAPVPQRRGQAVRGLDSASHDFFWGPVLAAELDMPGAPGFVADLRIAMIFCALIQGRPDWPFFAFHGGYSWKQKGRR
jgi:hypothetical protein